MPKSKCPLLSSLSHLLLEKYEFRDEIIAGGPNLIDLASIERGILSLHGTITRHRRSCPRCKSSESVSMPRPMTSNR
jgi:hypothetical protein